MWCTLLNWLFMFGILFGLFCILYFSVACSLSFYFSYFVFPYYNKVDIDVFVFFDRQTPGRCVLCVTDHIYGFSNLSCVK